MWRTLPARIALLTIVGVLLSFLVIPATHGTPAEQCSTRKIERLIEELGSDDYETRDIASRTLMDLEEAIPALEKARRSADLEVGLRVGVILQVLAKKRARQGLAKAKLLAKTGHIIEAADRVAYWGELDSAGEGWQILTQFAERVVESTARYFPPRGFWYTPKCPYGDFRRYCNNVHTKEITGGKILFF